MISKVTIACRAAKQLWNFRDLPQFENASSSIRPERSNAGPRDDLASDPVTRLTEEGYSSAAPMPGLGCSSPSNRFLPQSAELHVGRFVINQAMSLPLDESKFRAKRIQLHLILAGQWKSALAGRRDWRAWVNQEKNSKEWRRISRKLRARNRTNLIRTIQNQRIRKNPTGKKAVTIRNRQALGRGDAAATDPFCGEARASRKLALMCEAGEKDLGREYSLLP